MPLTQLKFKGMFPDHSGWSENLWDCSTRLDVVSILAKNIVSQQIMEPELQVDLPPYCKNVWEQLLVRAMLGHKWYTWWKENNTAFYSNYVL